MTGKPRPRTIGKLVEQQPGTQTDRPVVVDHPIMRFMGVIKGEPNSRDDALRINEILSGRDDDADSAAS